MNYFRNFVENNRRGNLFQLLLKLVQSLSTRGVTSSHAKEGARIFRDNVNFLSINGISDNYRVIQLYNNYFTFNKQDRMNLNI